MADKEKGPGKRGAMPSLNKPETGLYLPKPKPSPRRKAEAGPSSLFEALRAGNPSITEDELLRDTERLQEKQRKFLEEKQRQKVLQRLERRIEAGGAVPATVGRRRTSQDGHGGQEEPHHQHHDGEPGHEHRRRSAERQHHGRTSEERRRGSLEHGRGSLDQIRSSLDRKGADDGGHERAAQAVRSSGEHARSSAERRQSSSEYRRSFQDPLDGQRAHAPAAGRRRRSSEHDSVILPPQLPPHLLAQSLFGSSAPAGAAVPAAGEPAALAVGHAPKPVGPAPWTASASAAAGAAPHAHGAPLGLGADAPTAQEPPTGGAQQHRTQPNATDSGAQGTRPPSANAAGPEDQPGASISHAPGGNAPHPAAPSQPHGAMPVGGASSNTQLSAFLPELESITRKSPVAPAPPSGPPAAEPSGPAGREPAAPGAPAATSPQLSDYADAANVMPPGLLPPAGGSAARPGSARRPPLPVSGSLTRPAPVLALVEVQPLTDHFVRDEDGEPLQAPGPGAVVQAEGNQPGAGQGPSDPNMERTETGDTKATFEDIGDISQYSKPRQLAIRLCANPDFEMAVTLIIFANCVTLCLFDPRKPEDEGLNRKLFWAELAFNICFSLEMALRVLAVGSLVAYIKRPWNQFDAFMVIAGYTVFVPGNSSAINAIRALRALRPLRTITRFESLRGVIVCFLEAIPLLASVGGLLLFFIFIYAVAAVQLFPRTYFDVCEDAEGVPLDIGEDPDMFGCGGRGSCPANYSCIARDSEYTVNVAGFGNTGVAMLSVWQALTLTGWVFMMYRTVDAYSLWAVLYYFTLVFVGAYFVLNLFLAVLKIKFAKAQTLFHNQLALQRGKARRNSIMTFMSKVQSKWTDFSSKRSAASSLNSHLDSAIRSKMSSMHSPRTSANGMEDSPQKAGTKEKGLGRGGSDSGGPQRRGTGSNSRSLDGAVGALDVLAGDAAGGKHKGLGDGVKDAAARGYGSGTKAGGDQGVQRQGSKTQERPVSRQGSRAGGEQAHGGSPSQQHGRVGSGRLAVTSASDSEKEEQGGRRGRAAPSPLGLPVSSSGHRKDAGAAGPVAEGVFDPASSVEGAPLDWGSSTSGSGTWWLTAVRRGSRVAPAPAGPVAEGVRFFGGSKVEPVDSASNTARTRTGPPQGVRFGGPEGEAETAGAARPRGGVRFGGEEEQPARMPTQGSNQDLTIKRRTTSGSGGGTVGGGADGPPGAVAAFRPGSAAQMDGPRGEGDGAAEGRLQKRRTSGMGEDGIGERTYSAAPSSMGNTNVAMIVMSPAEFDEFVADMPYGRRQMLRLQYRVRLTVNHNIFNQFFMLLIFVNTAMLALEYNNQPESLTKFQEDTNYVLTALFTMEMILKLYGLGFWDYVRDGFNIFDALVVTISLLEIVLASVAGLSAVRALRVLKALRVLRLFKLFRYMQSLRRIGEVLLSAFSSFAAIAMLLFLFWLVFSIVGMHTFGAKDLQYYPWPNYSTFLYSMVATWNVLNLENWQNTMYGVVRETNYGSSMFFVFWIIIGRYIFLTLFLAVTLEAFEAKYDPNAVRLGAKGGGMTGMTSILSSLRSGLSSLRSGLSSRKRSHGAPDSPRGPKAKAAGRAQVAPLPDTVDDLRQPSFLKPGIGYRPDAEQLAAAQGAESDSAEPRVKLTKMYTIQTWIDTGNMDALKAEQEAENAKAKAAAGPNGTTAAVASGDWSRPGSRTTSATAFPRARTPPLSPAVTANAMAASFTKAGTGRGPTYINDSAAQSRRCSQDDVGRIPGTASRAPSPYPGPLGEGLEHGGSSGGAVHPWSAVPDPTLMPPSYPGPPRHGSGSNGPTGLSTILRAHGSHSSHGGPSRGGSNGPSPANAPGRGSPGLQSLSRHVRRSMEGMDSSRPGSRVSVAAGSRNSDFEDDDSDDELMTGGAGAGAANRPGSRLGGYAGSGGGMVARATPSQRGDALILSRAHGRSVRVSTELAPGRASLDMTPMTQMHGRSGFGAGQGGRASVELAMLPEETVVGGHIESAQAQGGVAGNADGVALAASSMLFGNYIPPPSAPAPLRGGGISPELLRMAGSTGTDEEGSSPVPVPGCAAPAANGTAAAPLHTAGSGVGLRAGFDSTDDLLGSFLEDRWAVGSSSNIPDILGTAGMGNRQSAGQDVIMATFTDMVQPPGRPPVPASPRVPPATAVASPAAALDPLALLVPQAHGVRRTGSMHTAPRMHDGAAAAAAPAPGTESAASAVPGPSPHAATHAGAAAAQLDGPDAVGDAAALDSGDTNMLSLAAELAAALQHQQGALPTPRADRQASPPHGPGQARSASGAAVADGLGRDGSTAAVAAPAPPKSPPSVPALNIHTASNGVPPAAVGGAGGAPPAAKAGGPDLYDRPSNGGVDTLLETSSGATPEAGSLQDSAHSMASEQGNARAALLAACKQLDADSEGLVHASGTAADKQLQHQQQRKGSGRALQPSTSSRNASRNQRDGEPDSIFGDLFGTRIRNSAEQDREDELVLGLEPVGQGQGKGHSKQQGQHRQGGSSARTSRSGRVSGNGGGGRAASGDGSSRDQRHSGGKARAGQGDAGRVGGEVRTEEEGSDAGRQVDKGPPMKRISEAGSVQSRLSSASHGSGASRASTALTSGTEGTDEEHAERHKKSYRKKRRASIMIEGTGKSFWIWDEDHPAREWAYWLVTHKRFDYMMFALILLNCVALALENPYIEDGSQMDLALRWSNIGFTIIFTIEAITKIFAYTFVAYIKRLTNQVDFLIVVSSILEIILMTITSSVGAVSALRVLRAFKPLRLLTRSAGMRLVFKSVTMSLMSMANVSVVCLLFFLIFAILGVQLFSGRFFGCNDPTVAGEWECVGNFTDPVSNVTIDRSWDNQFPNFDNTGNALLCCFITATLNGYTEIMQNAMSAPTEKGFQPVAYQNPGAFFWFFGFIVVCAFTLLNLYVGVIFSQFSKIRMMSETGSAFLTSDQNEWAELTKMVFRLKPPEKQTLPSGRLRRQCYRLANSRGFEMFILTIILINVGFLAASYYHEPPSFTRMKDQANIVFMSFFGAEAVLKLYALGWAAYFKVSWNRLDFLLLVLGILDLVLSMLQSNFLRILRVFRIQRLIALVRVARFAQVVKSVKGIQSLFSTLIYSLPAFGNVGALIGLFFFMYAYVGTFLFGKVQYGESLNRSVNFHNFFQSVLVLLRVATGDNWTGIMFDCMVMPPDCDKSAGTCGSYLAIPFFLSFVLLISVIMLNLFTAVIIETFEKTHEQEEWKLSPQALDDFVTLWSEYDDGSGTIAPRALEELLLRLDPPLGLGPYADNKDVLRFVYDLDIPLVNGRVPFHKTAFELVKRCSQAGLPEGAIKEQIDRLVDKFFHDLAAQDEMLNFSVAITVMKVQRKWRTRMRAAKLRRKKQWRHDREDAPLYPELVHGKAIIVERYDIYREVTRENAKAWEARELAAERKPDKAEVTRRMEARWKFNPTYAPPAIVAATQDSRGLLGLGKRAMNVNKLVGLIRGKKGFGGGAGGAGGGATEDGGLGSQQGTTDGGVWAAPAGGGKGPQQAGGTLPQRLLRAITASGTQLRVSLNGGAGDSPTRAQGTRGGLFGRREQVPSDTGMVDVQQQRRAPRRSFSADPSFRTRATTTSIPSPFTHDMSPLAQVAAAAREGPGSSPGTR